MGVKMTKRTEEKHFCQAGGVLKSMIFFWTRKVNNVAFGLVVVVCVVS